MREYRTTIVDCSECPNVKSTQFNAAMDEIGMVFQWTCKIHAKLIGWYDYGDTPPIPNWCPLPKFKTPE